MLHHLRIGTRKITFAHTEIMYGINQVGLATAIAAIDEIEGMMEPG